MALYHPATINTPTIPDRNVEAKLEGRRRLRELGFLEREREREREREKYSWMKM